MLPASLPLSEYSRVKEERISVGLAQSELWRQEESDLHSVTSREDETEDCEARPGQPSHQ